MALYPLVRSVYAQSLADLETKINLLRERLTEPHWTPQIVALSHHFDSNQMWSALVVFK
jgi:hypothetical protein